MECVLSRSAAHGAAYYPESSGRMIGAHDSAANMRCIEASRAFESAPGSALNPRMPLR